MILNADLLEQVIADIEKTPAKWDQASWAGFDDPDVDEYAQQPPLCGTTHCIAGNAMILSGLWRPTIRKVNGYWQVDLVNAAGKSPQEEGTQYGAVGAELLGLNEWQAINLFENYQGKDVSTLREDIAEILDDPSWQAAE
jgi:hypothetical protein